MFTNGCFDILHRGHVTYLAQARALGNGLLVAVNSDASVRRLGKGDDRPLNPLADRMAVLAALECVTLVTWFDEDTPLAPILDANKFSAHHVKVVTENGVVYLLGIVAQREADAAVEVARTTGGVRKVVRVFEIVSEADIRRLDNRPPAEAKPAASAK